MIRKILGFAVFALVALVVIKVALGLLGLLVGLVVSALVLAAMGYVLYLILRVVSPKTADRLQEVIRGRPTTTP
jgi:O-antigen/teichoic acid export membrane protein